MTTIPMEAAPAPVARPGFIANLRRVVAERRAFSRAYHRTFAELNALSDRDLADIGISRVQIRDIATDHAMELTGRI